MLSGTLGGSPDLANAKKGAQFAKLVGELGKLPQDKAVALADILLKASQKWTSKDDIVKSANEIGSTQPEVVSGIIDTFHRLTRAQQGELTCNHKAFVDIRQGKTAPEKAVVVEAVTEIAAPLPVIKAGGLSTSGLRGGAKPPERT